MRESMQVLLECFREGVTRFIETRVNHDCFMEDLDTEEIGMYPFKTRKEQGNLMNELDVDQGHCALGTIRFMIPQLFLLVNLHLGALR